MGQVDPVSAVMANPLFDERVTMLAVETGRTEDDIRRDARECLDEMTSQLSPRATALWDKFGRWLTRAYSVDVDTSALPHLRELSTNHSLVFLPNHRSYLDPLVLRRVLLGNGFPPNFILGGVNLALWPFSELAQRSGIVFIRRSTRDDPVYPEMMRLLLGHMLRSHDNLEWYFEGGRTRTGKLRPPRMGVLRYLVDAHSANDADAGDVIIVPVSIVYDQQHEVGAISAEEGGGDKRPESVGWLWSFARAQSRGRGKAHVRFGEPLSLGHAINEARERAGSPDPTTVVPRVAFEIAHRINDATPITPAALIAFSLLDNKGRALTLPEIETIIDPLLVYVRRRSLPLTSDVDLARTDGLLKALRTLVQEGVVEEYAGGIEPVFSIAVDRQHEAGFYRNTLVHWFVTRAISEVAMLRASEVGSADITATTWEGALALRDLLKYEFFFPTKAEFSEQLRAEVELAAPGWQDSKQTAAGVHAAIESTGLLLAHRVIGPILEGYLVAADRLAACEPSTPVNRDALVTECLGVAHQRWLQRELHSPESISKDLMSGALRLADNRGLLSPGGDEVAQARRAFADELREAVRRAGSLRQLVLDRMQEG
ncbi:MAG: 1-acyl-sn-glycerol-3-phosphate acyltransferase [Actinobacteria bacterium]|nr:1-acyl-sn-glycerol-3-phosphate acyltransferase [Actinomycetota bacterium]